MRSTAMICAAIALIGAAATTAFAQQKTVKACQEEWRANKADNQAKGITEKAYVATCRSGATAAAPASGPAPAATRSTAAPPPANMPAPAPTAAPAQRTATTPRAMGAGAANEFTTEALAKAHCPGDTVVWANLKSHIYHFQNSRDFGKTKTGAFMCEKDADSAGMRAAKNEKKPS